MADIDKVEAVEAKPGPRTAPVVVFGGREITLGDPPSLASIAINRTPQQIDDGGFAMSLCYGAAALFISWPKNTTWPVRPPPRRWVPGVNMAEYGYDVYEGLRAATKGEIARVDLNNYCIEAHNWVLESGLDRSEVEEARGFSGAPADG